jgi:hypothetical protein
MLLLRVLILALFSSLINYFFCGLAGAGVFLGGLGVVLPLS